MRYWPAITSCAALLGCAPAGAQLAARTPRLVTAFVNVAVIPMDRERVLADQTVLVQGGQIVRLGSAKQVRVPPGAVRIDGRGKYLIPGLADMHTHLAFADTLLERLLFLWLANGVTTIRNMDYFTLPHALDPLQLRARAAAGELWAPRIYTSGKWYTDTAKSIMQNVAAYKAAGFDFIKVHDEASEPNPQLDSLVDAARRVGIPVLGHPVGGLPYALEHRFASVEHLLGYPGGAWGGDSLADTVKIPALVAATQRAGAWICPTEAHNEYSEYIGVWMRYSDRMPRKAPRGTQYLPRRMRDYWRSVTAAGRVSTPDTGSANDTLATKLAQVAVATSLRRRTIQALEEAGVGLLSGTDAPLILLPGFGVHEELEALVQAGLTPYQALLTGTRNVAAYFGTLDRTGTVTVGKQADLVLVLGNPLADIRHAAEVAGVMVGGRWLSRTTIEKRLAAYEHD